MYKKLDQESINKLLEAAVVEFAENGVERASMNSIAKRAGLSVGVIYKYYANKESLFLECVRHSLELVSQTLSEAAEGGGTVRDFLRRLVTALIKHSREHSSYNAMYNEITSGSCRKYADMLAEEIESATAEMYSRVFALVVPEGADPRVFAFFFDDLLMMLQFSYSCDYYRRRMKIFCGDAADDDEKIVESFIKFMDGVIDCDRPLPEM